MNKNPVSRIAMIIYGLVMIAFSINHFRYGAGMAGAVPSYMPAHTVLVYLVGAGLALAGLAFIINMQVKLAGYLLGTMLLIIALTVQLPPVLNGTDPNSMFYAGLLKDTGLAAAAFFIASKAS